ncbi:response regulator transcription factor [Bifidobacterium choloepi]|uniref:Response regulator transcription factor n=1 Tax=Bifidobacterium choloepi TaxID=2614131 RepID=A0A6I5NCL8_9BIFI|nr:response regulator transcription factor [Bifidobacterium choloepi]NEG70280.1 response regulator transcription factor [Bifidobacterium choloepi]
MIDVMIVDDQQPIRMGFSLMIAKDHTLCMTSQAENGQDALDVLAALQSHGQRLPDVILMDVRMPVMDGLDATSKIKRLYPQIHVLVLTTYDEDSYAFGGLSAGASGFLLKDVRTGDLCRAIHSVYAGDAILTPRITKEVIRRGVPNVSVNAEALAIRSKFDSLGPREFEVSALVSEGLTNAEIAERLGMQLEAVKKAVSRSLAKLGVRERVNIAVLWYKAGMSNLQK